MELHLWLWLWFGVPVGSSLPHQPQRGEGGCRLLLWPQVTQARCRFHHRGALLPSWKDPHTRGLDRRAPSAEVEPRGQGEREPAWAGEEGGPHRILTPPPPQPGVPAWAEDLPSPLVGQCLAAQALLSSKAPPSPGQLPQWREHQSILRSGAQLWARKKGGSRNLFICRWEPPKRLRRAAPHPQQQRHHPCTVRCGPRPRPTREPVTAPPSFRPGPSTHPQAGSPTDASSTPRGPTGQAETGRQQTSSAQTPPGQPLESTEEQLHSTSLGGPRERLQPSTGPQPTPYDGPSRPPEADPGPSSKTTAAEGPGRPFPPSTGGSTLLSPRDKGQALEQLLCQFHQMVPSLGHPLAVERASQALQDLTSSPAGLSEGDQAQASHALHFLSSQLPTEALVNESCAPLAAAASSLFQSLSNLLVARGTEAPGAGVGGSQQQQQEQQRAALGEMLAALPLIQTGLFLAGSTSSSSSTAEPPSVLAESPALSTTLSSRSASSLPHSSFYLPQPQPLRVTFPSASALAPLLGRQPGPAQVQVQVQVASFALDPFRPLRGKAMGSVGSVALHTSEGPVSLHGLQEEIEVAFEGEEGVEASPAHLNGPSGHFSLEVNVTSLEDALLVSVRPASPLHITLRLAAPPQAPANCCLLNTTLPRGSWQDEGAYVWVVSPQHLQQHGPGTYSLSAEVASAQPPGGLRNVSVTIASTGCYHWVSQEHSWSSRGCRVGPESTLRRTQCLCSHLSFFGRFLVVVPHVIDFQHVGQLLSRVGQNPVGLALLCSLLLAYGALLLWACRKQKGDRRKAKVTVLGGSASSAASCCCYLVQVFTGYRRGAATSAKVVLTLYGTEGRSEPHLLQHLQAPSFEPGSMDAFLLTTQQPLGTLHAIRLWHDNTGAHPRWFVRGLVVSDLAARQKYHFPCGCWLAADMEEGQVDKVFIAASDRELRSFRYLFWAGLVEKLTQEHLWLSVVTCSAWSPFTRVQRLSCCLALLLCSLLINIMLWKGPEEEEQQQQPPRGPFLVTWRELMVSLEAAVLLLPLHLLIVHIFRWAQPPAPQLPPPLPGSQLPPPARGPSQLLPSVTLIQQELTETVGFLYKNPLCCCQDLAEFPGTWKQTPELVAGLAALIRTSLQPLEGPQRLTPERSSTLQGYLRHVVCDLEAQLRSLDWHNLPNPYDHLHALDQLCRLRQWLQQWQQKPQPSVKQPSSDVSSFRMEAPVEPRGPCSRGSPGRFQVFRWLVVATAGLASGFFTVLYSLKLSRGQATHWVTSIVLSELQGLLLMQPLKVVALSLVFALLRKRELGQDKGQEQELQRALGLAVALPCPPATPGSRDGTSNTIYRPPPLQPAAQAKGRALQEKKLYSLAREIVVQLLFLAVLMVLCYGERSPSEFHLSNALQKSFTRQVGNIQDLEHLYDWARHTLLPSICRDSAGFATDANSFLVGSMRLRQIRAEGDPEKPWAAFFWPQDDRGCPRPAWGPSSTAQEAAWLYHSEASLQEYPARGKFAVYPGGGYLAELGRNASHANSILRALAEDKWLDRCTRAVFVEFTVYNANVNLFCAVTVMLENNGLGAVASSTALQVFRLHPNSQMLVPLASAQLAFLLLLLYYIVGQAQGLKEQKWRHFHTKRSLLDAFSVLVSLSVVGLYVRRGLLAAGVQRQHRQDRSRFLRVSEMVATDAALTQLMAFLVALSTIQLWQLLRLNPRMLLISRTLQAAWEEIVGFLLTLLVLLVGYTFACNLLFGWSIASFKTFFDSAVTIVGLLAGIFNYEAVLALDPVLGSLLLVTCILSMVFVIINLFVSALLTIFSREMKAVSQEASMMQLIQLKISSLLGIKQWAPGPAPPLHGATEN
ncbi:LOW QUALITY PROTEIN: polycystin-1-like protein 3 [Heteronotia binoei]|uniref:LOW QUALITY PROTEIN: polycystin-1-like protein 3 n=1 Tax=Heteronotia binoei TaxID=13085 RepID=UPI002930933C|nr:LOW QUALITY PROTEIN: polycystin-1-like protein 3 [Heteronotia binoei]